MFVQQVKLLREVSFLFESAIIALEQHKDVIVECLEGSRLCFFSRISRMWRHRIWRYGHSPKEDFEIMDQFPLSNDCGGKDLLS